MCIRLTPNESFGDYLAVPETLANVPHPGRMIEEGCEVAHLATPHLVQAIMVYSGVQQ